MLTEREKEVLYIIKDFYNKYGFTPSYSELAKALKVSRGAVQHHVRSLKDKGYLEDNYYESIVLKK